LAIKNLYYVSLVAVIFVSGCAFTKITAVWKSSAYISQPDKILVIAIAKKEVTKRLLEDDFVSRIKERNTGAIASYTIIPEDKQNDDEFIAEKMKEQGANAVLITRFVDLKTAYRCVPGGDFATPYGTWRGYYEYGFGIMCSSGYVSEDDYAVMETNLYSDGKSDLIWTASSKTQILSTDQKFIKAYVKYIIKTMIKQKVLRNR